MQPQELWISPSGRIPEQDPSDDCDAKALKIVQKEYTHNLYCGKTPAELLVTIGWCGIWSTGMIAVPRLTRQQLDKLVEFRGTAIRTAGWEWFDEAFNKLVERDSAWI